SQGRSRNLHTGPLVRGRTTFVDHQESIGAQFAPDCTAHPQEVPMRLATGIGLACCSLVLVGGCSGKRLNGGGSTFVVPMMSKWTKEYEKAHGVQVNYQGIGSGGGIQQMTARTFDFGCTDAPMNDEQLEKCREKGAEAVHIPLLLGAIVPIY